jgi:hypothetical protein
MLHSELNSTVSRAETMAEFVEVVMNIQILKGKEISLPDILLSASQEYRILELENLVTS